MRPTSSWLRTLRHVFLFSCAFVASNLALTSASQQPNPPCHDARCNCIAGVSTSTSNNCATVNTLNVIANGGCCSNLTYGCTPRDCRFTGKIRLGQPSGGGCATIAGFCAGSSCGCSGQFVIPVGPIDIPCNGTPTTLTYTGCTSGGVKVTTVTVQLTCGGCTP